jgi:hypothetical protein
MTMTFEQARAKALAAGATDADIEAEARHQARHVGTVPFRNMIKALNMLPRLNGREEWTRLAGALMARRMAAK